MQLTNAGRLEGFQGGSSLFEDRLAAGTDRGGQMPEFVVAGPFEVPAHRAKVSRVVRTAEAATFWAKHKAFKTRRGCYVFGIRSGGGIRPMYVGKATKSFGQEVFEPHKLNKYN